MAIPSLDIPSKVWLDQQVAAVATDRAAVEADRAVVADALDSLHAPVQHSWAGEAGGAYSPTGPSSITSISGHTLTMVRGSGGGAVNKGVINGKGWWWGAPNGVVGYCNSPDIGKVAYARMRFGFAPGSGGGQGATACLAVTTAPVADLLTNLGDGSLGMGCHFLTTPFGWMYTVWVPGTGPGSAMQTLASGTYATPLARDALTEYELQVWIRGNTAYFIPPDGILRKVTDPRIGLYAGHYAFCESYSPGATDDVTLVSEFQVESIESARPTQVSVDGPTSASGAAIRAAGSAAAAATSATAASTSAGNASTSAGNANTSAGNAAQSASDATTAKNAAVAARDETVIAVGASVDWSGTVAPSSSDVSQARWWKRRLTGNTTLNLPDGVSGKAYSIVLEVKQDATGGRSLIVNQSGSVQVSWAYGVTPVMSTAANARDVWTLTWTGSEWIGGIGGQALAIGTGTGV